MAYQWYPGHMTKAVRMMQEQLPLIDLVIELLDARIPLASRNPDINQLGKNKYRVVLLNKADLADPAVTAAWKEYFESQGIGVVALDSRAPHQAKKIDETVKRVCAEKIERDRKRGIKNRPIRAMVCGIPNVGKSTFINSFAGRSVAKTGNKPGVTKGKQWIRLSDTLELLDTPGILWPKFEDQKVGELLAFIGSMNDEVIILEEMACNLISCLKENYSTLLTSRYNIDCDKEPVEILNDIAVKRGAIKEKGDVDYHKVALLIMEDFRSGKIGRISLERP